MPGVHERELGAVIKASGLCSFYIDLSCRNTLRVRSSSFSPEEAKSWAGRSAGSKESSGLGSWGSAAVPTLPAPFNSLSTAPACVH